MVVHEEDAFSTHGAVMHLFCLDQIAVRAAPNGQLKLLLLLRPVFGQLLKRLVYQLLKLALIKPAGLLYRWHIVDKARVFIGHQVVVTPDKNVEGDAKYE